MTLDDLQREIATLLTEVDGGAQHLEARDDLVEVLDSLTFQEVLLIMERYAGRPVPNAWLTDANFSNVETLLTTAERLRVGA